MELKLYNSEIVFFDLDYTLTRADTDELWARWRARQGVRGVIEAFRLLLIYPKYRAGRLNPARYMRFQRCRLQYLKPGEYNALCADFFRQHRGCLIPGMVELFRSYRAAGRKCVIITAQNEGIARPFADFLEADDLIANRVEYDSGRWDRPHTPCCFAQGKVHYAQEYAAAYGWDLEQCAFYSDSIHDLPLLSSVGYPVAVNPDRLLETAARNRKWEIIGFGE